MSGLIDLDVIAGAKATHRYARMSASKVRVVLNLIRDEDLDQARDRLRFCERGAAEFVSKVLESAVANATNNEQLEAEELYVAECWADEGPVIKRWRPRARGRATRIHKQTSHITVVVAQLSAQELALRESRLEASGADRASVSRSARVAASRARQSPPDAADAADVADAAAGADQPAAADPSPVEAPDRPVGIDGDGAAADAPTDSTHGAAHDALDVPSDEQAASDDALPGVVGDDAADHRQSDESGAHDTQSDTQSREA